MGRDTHRKGPLTGFRYAGQGLLWLWRTQPHVRVHVVTAIAVVAAGVLLGVSRMEWCLLVLAIGMVLAAEALNSALEALADAVHPEEHPLVGQAKDAAAAGVLLASLAAAVVGVMIFLPRLLALIGLSIF